MKKYEILKGNILIADRAKLYKDFFFKAKGLMFSTPLRRGRGIILEASEEGIFETTIHMLFVFFPIDVVWLDSNKTVVDVKRSVMPFVPWLSPCKPAKYVVEIKRGASKSICVGDRLEFREV